MEDTLQMVHTLPIELLERPEICDSLIATAIRGLEWFHDDVEGEVPLDEDDELKSDDEKYVSTSIKGRKRFRDGIGYEKGTEESRKAKRKRVEKQRDAKRKKMFSLFYDVERKILKARNAENIGTLKPQLAETKTLIYTNKVGYNIN